MGNDLVHATTDDVDRPHGFRMECDQLGRRPHLSGGIGAPPGISNRVVTDRMSSRLSPTVWTAP